MVEPAETRRLQSMLHAAVQSVRWTYSLFWQLCPQQGILVWGDGYYNGAIKTRKTVQPIEVSTEAATHLRSEHLRELYDSLSGESSGQASRPAAALSPEDLTETEWFYLMCVSFSFPPGVGMPGKSYVKRQHTWLTRANEVDSKIFSRSILAKSAGIQTVVCIPLFDGVVELGTTERVQEDIGLIQHVKTFFHVNSPPPRPSLSEQSTSNNPPALRFISPATAPTFPASDDFHMTINLGYDEDEEVIPNHQNAHEIDLDLMQLDTGIQFESSSNMNSDFNLRSPEHHWPSGNLQQGFPAYGELELEEEDTHYSQTVSTVLKTQSTRWSDSNYSSTAAAVTSTAFSMWSSSGHRHHNAAHSQRALKYILLTVPLLQAESPGGHVLAERRRREKLDERFLALRDLLPFVTKMDKASILDEAIVHMKELEKRIQELEGRSTVEVSIIDRDVLVEIECVVEKEGLLQRMMQLLGEVRMEVTTVQSSICNGVFMAELRAKVKEDGHIKKISIKEVKRSINQIISHFV